MAKPIVAFDLPEHRFTAQEAAVYAKPNDEREFAKQIMFLMDNPDQRHKMGHFGRKRIEMTLEWKYQREHLLEAYRTLDPSGDRKPSLAGNFGVSTPASENQPD